MKGLRIIVCIKSVSMKAGSGGSLRSYDSVELNPFDRPVLEMGLRLKEVADGHVTALSMGPDSGLSALSEAMAMGVDRAILACDPSLAGSDTLATSTALAAAIEKLKPFHLVLFGTRTADSDTGQVGPQTAVLLKLPFLALVQTVEMRAAGLLAERSADHFRERFMVLYPAVLSIHSGAVRPRDIPLGRIGSAFREQRVEIWNLHDLDLLPEQVGDAGSPTRVQSISRAAPQKQCDFLKGDLVAQVDELITRLSEAGRIG